MNKFKKEISENKGEKKGMKTSKQAIKQKKETNKSLLLWLLKLFLCQY
jgi:hypothetical protein